MIHNAADKRQNEINMKMAMKLRQQELEDLSAILSTERGRRFFIRLLERCFENKTTYTGNAQTYFNEGMRNVPLMLKQDIEAMGLAGLELKHAAEREYVLNQLEMKAQIEAEIGRSKK